MANYSALWIGSMKLIPKFGPDNGPAGTAMVLLFVVIPHIKISMFKRLTNFSFLKLNFFPLCPISVNGILSYLVRSL